ncbi:MAG: AcrR family transcriptional regulator [Candidatus Azotimanducaceae bacterium]|jgi:AcrR family transcriptional regulator
MQAIQDWSGSMALKKMLNETGKKGARPDKEPQQKQRRSRADTEQKLIDVALSLIRDKGVLAGLNLREVAEGAGVNRGNIYHYFGSRQELLRAAIGRRFKALVSTLAASNQNKRFVERRLHSFRMSEGSNDSKLRALLVLDGDDTVDPMPFFEESLSLLRKDVIDGDIHREHDLEALQVTLSALLRGYRIFREPYANRLDIDPDELDERVSNIMRTFLESVATTPSSPDQRKGAQ